MRQSAITPISASCSFARCWRGAAELPASPLRVGVADALAALDVQDARLAFRAIALASPGGLGRRERHDVHQAATVTLREAMADAAARDRIARQYATTFDDVFDLGVPLFEAAERRWGQDQKASTLAVYLGFLAAFPDTHIQRKHGAAVAAAVQKEAEPLRARFEGLADPAAMLDDLLVFDASLKRRGINPGASADSPSRFFSRADCMVSNCRTAGDRQPTFSISRARRMSASSRVRARRTTCVRRIPSPLDRDEATGKIMRRRHKSSNVLQSVRNND